MDTLFLVILMGLCTGSFLNVVIARLPKMLIDEWQAECRAALEPDFQPEPTRYNLAWPRSHCPNCKTQISWYDNLPVLSFLYLQGRCRHCQRTISWQYPLVEILNTCLMTLIYCKWALSPMGLAAMVLAQGLLVLSFIDLEHLILPDDLTFPLLWGGLLLNQHYGIFVSGADALSGCVIGYLSLWSIFWIFKLCTQRDGMGYGDFKLLAVLGAWFGWQALAYLILAASLLGSVVGLCLMGFYNHPKQRPIPFGPFLSLAALSYLIWQPNLILSLA